MSVGAGRSQTMEDLTCQVKEPMQTKFHLPLNSFVEVLTRSTSECDHIWR